MKVNLEHIEKSEGVIRKKRFYGVTLSIQFNEEERAIIKERKLEKTVLMERGYPADVSDRQIEKQENRGLIKSLAKIAVKGTDSLSHNLTFSKLLLGADTYWFDTPLEAKEYEGKLREELPIYKQYIVENESIEQKSDSFEL